MELHFAVSGFVVNPSATKLLMVHHKKLNAWVIPGGHLEPNELPHEGAQREIKEETGVFAVVKNGSVMETSSSEKETQLPCPFLVLQEFIPEKGDKPAHYHVDLVYVCVAEEAALSKQEAEVNDVKWMTWDEVLATNTFDSIKNFAKTMKGGGSNERAKDSLNTILQL